MELTQNQRAVFNLLTEGQLRITTAEISELIGMNRRTIADTIDQLIRKGVPIVAERHKPNNGYYIATSKEELYRGVAQYKQQMVTEKRRISALTSIDLDSWRERLA